MEKEVKYFGLWCPNCNQVEVLEYIDMINDAGNPVRHFIGRSYDRYEDHGALCLACGAGMKPVDHRLLCIIQALNVKGYPTLYCGEGHWYDNKEEAAYHIGCGFDYEPIQDGPYPYFDNFYIGFPDSTRYLIQKYGDIDSHYFTWSWLNQLTLKVTAIYSMNEKSKRGFEELKEAYLKSLENTVAKLPILFK